MKNIKENFCNRDFIITITNHIFEARKDEDNMRGYNYDYQDIKEILYLSVKNGLTSFRNKGVTLIKYKRDDGRYSFMILEMCGSAEYPEIKVVSILDSFSKDIEFRPYRHIKNRIFLTSFILERKYSLNIVTKKDIEKSTIKIKKKKIIRDNRPINNRISKEEQELFLNAFEDLSI